MPFQIHNIAAYREVVLNELRHQARTPDTETYRIVRGGNYDNEFLGELNKAHGCYDRLDKVLWYSYCYMPQHFDALQRVMQLEEQDAPGVMNGDTFQRKVFNTDGDLLVVDVGCGPMTAGVALADWYAASHPAPLKLSYVGLDDSEHCATIAKRFAARRDLFDMQHPPLFYANCSDCRPDELAARLTSDGTLLFMFSYIFGQDSCNQEHLEAWALFMRQVMTACNAKNNLLIYTNSPSYKDNSGQWMNPNVKYTEFCKLLGWQDQDLQFKTGGRYRYPKRTLRGFNEEGGPTPTDPTDQAFRHILVDATLVDKMGTPIREDKRRP